MKWSKQEDTAMDRWSPVGDTAYVETVSRTVTYTFAPTSVDVSAFTYYDETAATGIGLDGAGWYFSGTITGDVSEYINGTENTDFSGTNSTYEAESVFVTVLLTDEEGGEVDVDDVPDYNATYTATFILSGDTASYSGTEYNTYAWSIDLTASGTDSGNSTVGDIFYASESGQTVGVASN